MAYYHPDFSSHQRHNNVLSRVGKSVSNQELFPRNNSFRDSPPLDYSNKPTTKKTAYLHPISYTNLQHSQSQPYPNGNFSPDHADQDKYRKELMQKFSNIRNSRGGIPQEPYFPQNEVAYDITPSRNRHSEPRFSHPHNYPIRASPQFYQPQQPQYLPPINQSYAAPPRFFSNNPPQFNPNIMTFDKRVSNDVSYEMQRQAKLLEQIRDKLDNNTPTRRTQSNQKKRLAHLEQQLKELDAENKIKMKIMQQQQKIDMMLQKQNSWPVSNPIIPVIPQPMENDVIQFQNQLINALIVPTVVKKLVDNAFHPPPYPPYDPYHHYHHHPPHHHSGGYSERKHHHPRDERKRSSRKPPPPSSPREVSSDESSVDILSEYKKKLIRQINLKHKGARKRIPSVLNSEGSPVVQAQPDKRRSILRLQKRDSTPKPPSAQKSDVFQFRKTRLDSGDGDMIQIREDDEGDEGGEGGEEDPEVKREREERLKKEQEERKKNAKRNLRKIMWCIAYPIMFSIDIDEKVKARKMAQYQDLTKGDHLEERNLATWIHTQTTKGLEMIFADKSKNYDFVGSPGKVPKQGDIKSRSTRVQVVTKSILDQLLNLNNIWTLQEATLNYIAMLSLGENYGLDYTMSIYEIQRLQFNYEGRHIGVDKSRSQMLMACSLIIRGLVHSLILSASTWNNKIKDWTELLKTNLKVISSVIYHLVLSFVEMKNIPVDPQSLARVASMPIINIQPPEVQQGEGIPLPNGPHEEIIKGLYSREELNVIFANKVWVDGIHKAMEAWLDALYNKLQEFRQTKPALRY